ncbi:host attachment protein [Halomonas sp. MCCC 1A11062]|uniref:host attachment protein n=1 Tax=Halomonas sp. MCCC 1A11062 TaxID=2733485 RepID=UPI001F27138B|nr:host attachment protein [Halomonas sp. MCCC 1A11062]MCE8038712.1 host attachment protein [Halomonas sp. MCCC 1A11062]
MKATWVVVADQARARFFTAPEATAALEEVDTLVNPEGKLHERDINADRPGRTFDSMGVGRHAMGKHHSPKEQEAIRFATAIGERLGAEYGRGALGHVVLCAPPRFLGFLKEALPEQVMKCVSHTLDKELASLSPEEIRAHLPGRPV